MRLALPALGALAAEPLYVLGDTAIVGTREHGGPRGAGARRSAARRDPRLRDRARVRGDGEGVAAVRRRAASATRSTSACRRRGSRSGSGSSPRWSSRRSPIRRSSLLAGGATPAYEQALIWLRIAALGAPFVLVTAAGQGWMRGFQDTRTPFAVLGIANLSSICLSLVLVQGVGLGIEGSAIANVVAQVASGATFVILLIRRGAPLAPSLERIRGQMRAARDLALRTASFFAAFTTAAAVAARMGDAQLAAHQIGFQLWILVALALDSIAIAAQTLVGSLLGAGDVDAAWVARPAAAALRRALRRGGRRAARGRLRRDPAALHLRPGRTRPGRDPVAVVRRDAAVLRRPLRARRRPARSGRPASSCATSRLPRPSAGSCRWCWSPPSAASGSEASGPRLAAFIGIRLAIGLVHWRGRAWLVPGTVTVDGM